MRTDCMFVRNSAIIAIPLTFKELKTYATMSERQLFKAGDEQQDAIFTTIIRQVNKLNNNYIQFLQSKYQCFILRFHIAYI